MAQKVQKWSPDSCACVLLETWDDTTTEAARVHTFSSIEQLCAIHAGLGAGRNVAHYDAVRSENRRKNLVAVIAKTVRPAFVDADYTWSFNASRQVVATIANLTTAQKNSLQAAADLQFGPGLVIVQ